MMFILQSMFSNKEEENKDNNGLDLWFGALDVDMWKQECFIDNVFLKMQGDGHLNLEIIYVDHLKKEKIIFSDNLNITDTRYIHIDEWSRLDRGFLYLRTKKNVERIVLSWATDTKPRKHISLGLVITHFNRKQFVVPAIKRLQEELVSKYKDISLIVVDNSQSITEEEACGATVIKNENYGGSGGFTRGLLHLKDHGFTHCLFMDDDATCEIESILRAYRIFQYASDESLAVSGSLFDETHPNVLIDKGAVFKKGRWTPLNHGLDLSCEKDFLKIMTNKEKVDYGGWWFFGFNINYIKNFPFPTFVRGDDVLFSLDNKFNIITPLGVNCWADNFFVKDGPIQRYLDMRSLFLINTVYKKASLFYLIPMSSYRFLRMLLTFHYESCSSYLKAMTDFVQGPEFFRNNLNASHIFAEISAWVRKEKIVEIDVENLDLKEDIKSIGLQRVSKTVGVLFTLNGLCFPRCFKKKQILKQNKDEGISLYKAFRYNKICYLLPDGKNGILVEEEKLRAVKLISFFIILMGKFLIKYPLLSYKYKKAHKEFTSEKFWRDVYNL